jgi:uncharacterized membrane protein
MVWLYLAEQIYFVPDLVEVLESWVFTFVTTRAGWSVIVYGNVLGGLFAFALPALSVFRFLWCAVERVRLDRCRECFDTCVYSISGYWRYGG